MTYTIEFVYLVSSSIQVGKGYIEQVILESVDARWNCKSEGFFGLVHNLVPQYMIQSPPAKFWRTKTESGNLEKKLTKMVVELLKTFAFMHLSNAFIYRDLQKITLAIKLHIRHTVALAENRRPPENESAQEESRAAEGKAVECRGTGGRKCRLGQGTVNKTEHIKVKVINSARVQDIIIKHFKRHKQREHSLETNTITQPLWRAMTITSSSKDCREISGA